MPRINETGYSNYDTIRESELFDAQGNIRTHMGAYNPSFLEAHGGEPSPGTSSSTSESKPEPSGSTAPETESLTPSPAPDAESPSEQDPQASQAPSSTASSTDGSGQGTGPSRRRQRGSSEESAAATPATPATTDGHSALHMAREAFDRAEYDVAEAMLREVEALDPSLAPEVAVARDAIAAKTAQP